MDGKLDPGRCAEILLADDSENEAELTRIGFKKSGLRHNLHHVLNGVECLAFLRKQGEYAKVPAPDLLLLDLNMPIMNGREVLAEIMSDENLRSIPVLILSTSGQDEEILKMYKLGCRSYIVKPVDFNRFLQIVRSLVEYWFNVVVLPSKVLPGKVSAEEAKAGAGVTLAATPR
ncbi:MAG: response regulator [Bryobacteraceae bacterium]|jgi:two-component system response regulator